MRATGINVPGYVGLRVFVVQVQSSASWPSCPTFTSDFAHIEVLSCGVLVRWIKLLEFIFTDLFRSLRMFLLLVVWKGFFFNRLKKLLGFATVFENWVQLAWSSEYLRRGLLEVACRLVRFGQVWVLRSCDIHTSMTLHVTIKPTDIFNFSKSTFFKF